MNYNHEAQQALNAEHRIRPRPGDVWHEMYCVLFLVIWTDGEHIEYLDNQNHQKSVDASHWTWTFEKPENRCTVEEFRKRISYGSGERTFCDVFDTAPKHQWAVEEALKTKWGQLFKKYGDGKVVMPGMEPKTVAAGLGIRSTASKPMRISSAISSTCCSIWRSSCSRMRRSTATKY